MLSVPSRPLIGITACHQQGEEYSTQKVSEKYVSCIPAPVGGLPLIIPALEAGALDLDSLVAHLDGLLLTGSPSNVEPHHFNGPDSVEGTLHDPRRDNVTLPLIRKAVGTGIPVLGICRGIQEMNVAFGGTLHQRIFDMEDRFDHRMRQDVAFSLKYRPAHEVRMTKGGQLSRIAGTDRALVNSLHGQGIDQPGEGIAVEAVAPDGIIEAISVPGAKAFALGVQWHPEWPVPIKGVNRKIFEAFGDACRAHLNTRLGLPTAAE